MKSNKITLLAILLFVSVTIVNCQQPSNNFKLSSGLHQHMSNKRDPADSTKRKTTGNVSISGLFLSIGTGLSVPVSPFKNTSNPVFGIFGRLEFASTSIFPLVLGGEAAYFSYGGDDNYMTQNLLNSFQTKIFSYGLTAEFTFARLIRSHYTIPFLCVDVKSNKITRSITGNTLPGVPLKETKVSFGGGFGFTLFVLDFFVKYTYMKDLSSFGVFTKLKFPLLRF